MFIKICGTTNQADAELAVALGADALGFIFAPSKRQVHARQVAAMVAGLPAPVERVGVFTKTDAEEIGMAVREAHLTAVQLHMPQNPQLLDDLYAKFGEGLQLWQVVPFEVEPPNPQAFEQTFVRSLRAAFGDARIAKTLLDASKGGHSGGLGQSFPWRQAAVLIKQARQPTEQEGNAERLTTAPLLLAGGLQAENVREAIDVLEPFGVDCVSGVEAEPGRKDPTRLAAFITAAHLQ